VETEYPVYARSIAPVGGTHWFRCIWMYAASIRVLNESLVHDQLGYFGPVQVRKKAVKNSAMERP
jgi:hypothetical protein